MALDYLLRMEIEIRYRGRSVTPAEVDEIKRLISVHPLASRRKLSRVVCEAWDWRQENGELRDMVCRSLMLALHRAGQIELPPVRCRPPNNAISRRRRAMVPVDTSSICGRLKELRPLVVEQVRRTEHEALFDSLVEEHHYLAYTRPVGEHLKYLIWAQGRPVACSAWSSAPRHLGPRDRFIGWSAPARRRNLHLLAYNTRFLILPWVEVPHLASHLLGRLARVLPGDWKRVYSHPVHYLETFVDLARFKGTCYRAANWRFLGPTTGRGHNARTSAQDQPVKEVLGYPLRRDFRALLAQEE